MDLRDIQVPEGHEVIIRLGGDARMDSADGVVAELWRPSQVLYEQEVDGRRALRHVIACVEDVPRAIKVMLHAMWLADEVKAGRVPPGYKRADDGRVVADLADNLA